MAFYASGMWNLLTKLINKLLIIISSLVASLKLATGTTSCKFNCKKERITQTSDADARVVYATNVERFPPVAGTLDRNIPRCAELDRSRPRRVGPRWTITDRMWSQPYRKWSGPDRQIPRRLLRQSADQKCKDDQEVPSKVNLA